MADDHYPLQPSYGTPLTRGPLAAVLWGAFLGCSWTWVIGMVFPALLLRDHGLWGWIVFAVPNVLGAAAMGAVLYKPDWSAAIVRSHGPACHHFTVATVAFQLYVVAWLFSMMFGLGTVPILVVAIGLCAVIGLRNARSAMLFVAVGVMLISWGCFTYATRSPGAWAIADGAAPANKTFRLTTTDLLVFAPCALLGFALCPYLDLTFHRARYSTAPRTGVAAFTIGFCIIFALMIVFSVCYAGQLLPFIRGESNAGLSDIWLVLLAVHLSLQAGFTTTVHVRESIENPKANTPWLVVASGLAIVLGLSARLDPLPAGTFTGGLTWGEAGYRGLLLLYGTVFPGYVWLVMIPTLRPLSERGKQLRWWVFGVTSIATYALGWTAFVMGHMLLLLVLIGVMVISRIVIELLPREANPTPKPA